MAGLTARDVCVLIPAYNEETALPVLVQRVRAEGFSVVVADDGSTDRTAEHVRALGVTVLTANRNGGKGAALRRGFEWLRSQPYRALITMDADGQHDPKDLRVFLEALAQGRYDVIVGDRSGDRRSMPPVRRVTNALMSRLLSAIAGQRIPDSQCGYRALTREALERIRLDTDHFEIESEMLLAAAQAGCRIPSLPVHCIYAGEKSHIRPLRDTWRFVRFLFTHRHLFRR